MFSFKSIAIVCVVIVTAVTGCAVQPSLPLEQRIPLMTPSPTDGAIVMRVQVAQTVPAPQNSFWYGASFASTDGKAGAYAVNVEPGHAAYTTFVKLVPAGKYRPSALDARYMQGNTTTTYNLPLKNSGEFEVRAGEITDLGTLAIITTAKPVKTTKGWRETGSTQALVAFPITSSAEESDQLMSIVRTKLPNMKVRRGAEVWKLTEIETLLSEPAFRQGVSSRFLSPVTSQGTSFAGEELGQVRVRRGDEWRWLDTGLSHSINAVDALDDGTVLVGGSQGMILARSVDDPKWRSLALPLPDGVVQSLLHAKGIGIVATASSNNELVVFKRTGLTEPWTELRRIPFAGRISNTFYSTASENGVTILVAEMGFSMTANLHFMTAATGTWSVQPMAVPWTGILGSVSTTPQGSLFVNNGGTAMSQSLRVTEDGGKTWETRESPQWVISLSMLSRERGYALRIDSLGVASAKNTVYSVWKTADGGRGWQRVSTAPALFVRLVAVNDRLLVGLTAEGETYLSNDEGTSWKQEKD